MKKIEYIKRDKCVVTGANDLDFLHKLEGFPIFAGCSGQDRKNDQFAVLDWGISKSSGIIQLTKLLPTDLIYAEYHSEAVGGVWKKHHEKFSEFLLSYANAEIVEMGGSNGKLAELCLATNPNLSWTIIEPKPEPGYTPRKNIELKTDFIENSLDVLGRSNTFVHSHVLEHLYEPLETLKKIASAQNKGHKMIFSIPNLYKYLENKFANAINFEHTYFLTEEVADFILGQLGYEIEDKEYFLEHSIFYSAVKKENINPPTYPVDLYSKYKNIYFAMIDYFLLESETKQSLIEQNPGPVYMFGAGVFSQFLLYMGIDEINIAGILDNSPDKKGKRLYGTGLKVFSPSIISGMESVMVIVKAGQYQEEVEAQLLDINENVKIVR
jgi:hypothetical protein